MQLPRILAVVALGLATGACSSTPPAATPAPPAAPKGEAQAVDPGPSSYEGETGGLNEEAVERAFGALQSPLQSCLEQGSSRLRELGGKFRLSLRIDRAGATKWVYLSESSLGDRATEKCVLDAARAHAWPKPVGGEGLAAKAFDIEPRSAPVAWDAKKAKRLMPQVKTATAKCRKGVEGAFVATAYIHPTGRVLSAGVAPPNERGEDKSDCVVDALRKLRFAAPGAKSAKVSFTI